MSDERQHKYVYQGGHPVSDKWRDTLRRKRERGAAFRKDPSDPRHGTVNGYTNLYCRCQACKDSYRNAQLVAVPRRKAIGLPDGDSRHGTYNGYNNWGCRCDSCKAANSARAQDYRARKKKRDDA